MIHKIPADEFASMSRQLPVIDVRSPAEYAQGHVPGAVNLPLFSDEERSEVGTIYKQIGQSQALLRGLEIVGPKIRTMYEQARELSRDNAIMVYCWRGGKRSESVAELLSLNGLSVKVMVKGYKAFRNWTLQQFTIPRRICIVGGRTGSGKTELIHALHSLGEQVADLEALADHRGSSFGKIGLSRHVTQQQFENDLAVVLLSTDSQRRLWLEDESRHIGKLVIPEILWKQMRVAEVFFLDLDKKARVQRLLQEYGHFSPKEISAALLRISDKLGSQRYAEALHAIETGNSDKVIGITLAYYDKTYSHGLSKRNPQTIRRFEYKTFDAIEIARAFVQEA